MGCDIHLIAEVRHRYEREGATREYWRRVAPPVAFRCPWCVEMAGEHPQDTGNQVRSVLCWFCDRSYDTFAILANVRNGYGFAGSPTGDGFNPISEPRGYPTDLSDEGQHWVGMFDHPGGGSCPDLSPGDHSASWLLLRELQEYDWNQRTGKTGVLTLAQFAEREAKQDDGYPDSWSGAVMGPGVTTISEDNARHQLTAGGVAVAEGCQVYVQTRWGTTYRRAAQAFYDRVMPGLASLGAPDDVRIVFSFDS